MGGPRDLKICITPCFQWVIERYSTYTDWAINRWVSIVLSSYFLQVLVTFCWLSNDRVLSLLDRAGGSQPKTSEYFWVQISKVGRHRGTPEQTGSSISFLGTALTISWSGASFVSFQLFGSAYSQLTSWLDLEWGYIVIFQKMLCFLAALSLISVIYAGDIPIQDCGEFSLHPLIFIIIL